MLQRKVHSIDIVEISYYDISNVGEAEAEPLALLATLHMSSQLRSSLFFQCPCTVKEPCGPPRPLSPSLAGSDAARIWTVGIAAFFLLCYRSAKQPATSWDWGRKPKRNKRKEVKNTRQHQHSNKYCSSQNWHHFLFGMHRAGPGQVNLSFYRNTMRNMQQQRQYIINLIVSWAFWDIQDERLNNLQSFVEQQWREWGKKGREGSISEPGNMGETFQNTRESQTVEHTTWEWTADLSTGGRRSTIWSFP